MPIAGRTCGRAAPPLNGLSFAARSPAPPHEVDIQTPPGEIVGAVEYFHIPWFGFEAVLKPQCSYLHSPRSRRASNNYHQLTKFVCHQLTQTLSRSTFILAN